MTTTNSNNESMFDLIIIGGGPAGVAAGVYASRKRLKTAIVAETFGGQSTVSEGIENWIGTIKISGPDLAKSLKEHLKAYAGDIVTIYEGERAQDIAQAPKDIPGADARPLFTVTLASGKTLTTRTVLIATGSSRRKLPVAGADRFEHKGITYCASCDGPIFADQDVLVVGGGNAAFESASQLLAYCKSVHLFNRSDVFRADEVTVAKVLAHPKMKAYKNTDIVSVEGEKFVSGVTYKNSKTGETGTLPVTGIFIEIGSVPATDFAKNVVKRTDINTVVTDPRTQRTSQPGIWAAGDCTDGLYHQNNIAAGDAVKALEDIYLYLHAQ